MKNRRNLIFNIGDENRIVVENIDKETLEASIFSEPYHYALDALNSYVGSMPTEKDKRIEEEKLWRNNIFAFIGDRGSGKTSCMQSVAQLLVKPTNLKEDNDNKVFGEKFHKIDMVDPSFVDNDSNVVGVILASLYKQYQEYFKEHKGNESQRIELATRFAKVQHDFYRMMESDKTKEDDLESLSSLSAAIDLKQSMLQLVDSFMEYIGEKNAILLVPVDDIDLHSKAATDMVEQIRKYLVLPNVVVLMAVKMSQLSKLKRLQFSKEYQDGRNTLSDTELDEMVEKYITKLVPYGHRIYMPDANYYWNALVTIKRENEIECEKVSIRQFIPELIFKKTRYLFYNSSIKTSYIVPDNLRELRQLMRLLYDMPDYIKDGEIVKNNNKVLFKKYLFQSWMMNHLDAKSQSLIRELLSVTDSIQVNAFALRIIRNKFYVRNDEGKIVAPWDNENKELDYIMRKENMVYNIAIGDVLAVIDCLERLDITIEQMYFLFMIKTIYSIRLYEYYVDYCEELTEKMIHEAPDDIRPIEHIFKKKLFEGMALPDYFKLMGGRLFNTRASLILPVALGPDSVSRSNRVIYMNALNELMKKCVDHSDGVSPDEIKMAEFFMLCTARVYRSRNKPKGNNDYYEPGFRTNRDIVYAVSFGNKPNAFFDIASFMYNIIDVKRCYGRFKYGKVFLKKVQDGENAFAQSLFASFRQKNLEKLGKEDENQLSFREKIGWFSIRNIEILQDLTIYLDEYSYKDKTGDIGKLIEFFSRLASYEISSYDKAKDALEYNVIDYKFVQAIVDLLNVITENNSLTKVFHKIYDGYLAKDIDKEEDDGIELPALQDVLAEYQANPLQEQHLRDLIKHNYAMVDTIRKNLPKKVAAFKDPRFAEILNEGLTQIGENKIKQEHVHAIYEYINHKITYLIPAPDGNLEANNQDPLPAPEEPDGH